VVKLKMDVVSVDPEGRVVLRGRQETLAEGEAPSVDPVAGVIATIPLTKEAVDSFPVGGIVSVTLDLAYDPRA